MCAVLLWLWVCFAGGIGALANGDTEVGLAATGAGVVTLVYLGTPKGGERWAIRAVVVVLWLLGGLLLWNWTVEDWAVALRIGFGALGGTALLVYLLRSFNLGGTPRSPSTDEPPATR